MQPCKTGPYSECSLAQGTTYVVKGAGMGPDTKATAEPIQHK